MQFGSNPFANAPNLKSPFIQLATFPADTLSSDTLESGAPSPNFVLNAELDLPMYFVSLRFAQPQDFNFSPVSPRNRRVNFTLPECTTWLGSEFSFCSGCNVSSFTNSNVTFACHHLDAICGSRSFSSSRALAGVVNVVTDDFSKGSFPPPVKTVFGAKVVSFRQELSSVHSPNPWSFDVGNSKGVLIFVAILGLSIVAGALVLKKVDHNEKAFIVSKASSLSKWSSKLGLDDFTTSKPVSVEMLDGKNDFPNEFAEFQGEIMTLFLSV